jgi:uncharacterized protein (TIGR03086 family)
MTTELAADPIDEFSWAGKSLTAILQVVKAIGDDELYRPTPCRDWDVATLADHLVDTIARLGAAAVGTPAEAPGSGSIDQRIQRVTRPILAEWRRRGLAGDIEFAGRTLPAHLALGILNLELVVHGWDFAIALGSPLAVTDTHASHVLNLACQTLTTQSRIAAGFDAPVSVPADSGALDRLVALTGRDPQQQNRR